MTSPFCEVPSKMAASLVRSVLGASGKKSLALRTTTVCQTWTRTAFFRRGKDKEKEMAVVDDSADQAQLAPPSALTAATRSLRKREGLQTVRSYLPPADVEQRVQGVVSLVCGNVDDWTAVRLDDNRLKFKILDGVMRACDHTVPNTALVELRTVRDVVSFFSTPVRDTTVYQDLAAQDLPPNLHIQLEPLRFDPETDTMFGGVSAFPDRPTVVTSLKYRRKYGNNQK